MGLGTSRRGLPTPESARRQPETQVEYRGIPEGLKGKLRPTENNWSEIREDSEELLQTSMDFDWFWGGSGEPVLVASLGLLKVQRLIEEMNMIFG